MSKRDILDAINKSLMRIGRTTTTRFPEHLVRTPKGASNKDASNHVDREKRLFEYMVSDALVSLASARKKSAKTECEVKGDFDFEAGLTPENKREYSGDTLDCTSTMSNPSHTVSLTKLTAELRKSGVVQATIDKCVKAAKKPSTARRYRTFTPKEIKGSE